jgi:tetratricopeptide (TPR) repeat protein
MFMAESIIKEVEPFINSGNLTEALKVIEKAIKVNPYHAPGWELRGRIYDALGNTSEAQANYHKARRLGMDALMLLASGKGPKKRTGKFDSTYTKPIGYALFQDAESWTQQGASLVSLYKLEEALFCYEKALKLNPDYIPAKENKSFLLRLLGWKE